MGFMPLCEKEIRGDRGNVGVDDARPDDLLGNLIDPGKIMLIEGFNAGFRMRRDKFRCNDFSLLSIEEKAIAGIPEGEDEPLFGISVGLGQFEPPKTGSAPFVRADVRRPAENRSLKNSADPLLAEQFRSRPIGRPLMA